ncbi:MAG: aldehyde dehydrogenase family protein, partial [Pseudoxanthomonas sp.]
AQGAVLRTGGAAIDGPGWLFQPTVLTDVPATARVMNEEPFGPVAVISRFHTYDEAIEQDNRLPFGLAAYAFTQSAKTAMLVGEDLEAGMIGINSLMVGSADAPFCGIKDSGHGVENALEGLEACLTVKQVTQG